MSRLSITQLITEDLGYCCPFIFFRLYRRTSVIADRLGVAPSTVRAAKAKVDSGESQCTKCDRCLRTKITLAGTPRTPREPV